MDGTWGEVRVAMRTLLRAPTFTLVAVVTLGLGIGANTAIYSIYNRVMLQSLPYEDPASLVQVWLERSDVRSSERTRMTGAEIREMRAEPGLFEALAGWSEWSPTLTGLGEAEVIRSAKVTQGMFSGVLRVAPMLGRSFLPEEDRPGGPSAALLSHAFWQARFAGDPTVIGSSVVLDEVPYTVVGVMPPGFSPPFTTRAALWTPAQLDGAPCIDCVGIDVIGRVAGGIAQSVAAERASAVVLRMVETRPELGELQGARLVDLHQSLVGPAAEALRVLLVAVGLVLLIACINVAHLLLARGARRDAEFLVRHALGARRGALIKQLLVESTTLAAVGGLVGLGLAAWGTELLLAVAPVDIPGLNVVSLDGGILAFNASVALGTGVLFGLFPAVGLSRREGGLGGVIPSPAARRPLRRGLIVGQVAIAMVLLVAAGLLMKSLRTLGSTEMGFEPAGVFATSVTLPETRFSTPAHRALYFRALIGRLETIPGVEAAGATSELPLSGVGEQALVMFEDEPEAQRIGDGVVTVRRVTPGYFYAIGQRILEGRRFEEGDDGPAPLVAVINESLAERDFEYPHRNPLGARIAVRGEGGPTWRTIVGVVRNARGSELREPPRPTVYLAHAQAPTAAMSLVLRTLNDGEDLMEATREAVSDLDPLLAPSRVAPLDEWVDRALRYDRFATAILMIFAGLAVTLAAVGLFGVLSHGVAAELRDVAIRVSVGADGEDMKRRVVALGLSLTFGGIAIGTLVALALTGMLETMLFGVSARDPVTFGSMAAVLMAAAVAATWLPGRRAAGADPVSLLREE